MSSEEISRLLKLVLEKQDSLSVKQDTMQTALNDTSLKVAVLTSKFETVDERGCAASIQNRTVMEGKWANTEAKVNKVIGATAIISTIFSYVLVKTGIK